MFDGFGERLRKLRKQREMTQSDLASLVDMHYQNIGRYERGLIEPPVSTLRRLAEALGVSADYLSHGNEHPPGGPQAPAPIADKELLKQFQEAEKLPEDDKELVKRFLGAFLTTRKIEALVTNSA